MARGRRAGRAWLNPAPEGANQELDGFGACASVGKMNFSGPGAPLLVSLLPGSAPVPPEATFFCPLRAVAPFPDLLARFSGSLVIPELAAAFPPAGSLAGGAFFRLSCQGEGKNAGRSSLGMLQLVPDAFEATPAAPPASWGAGKELMLPSARPRVGNIGKGCTGKIVVPSRNGLGAAKSPGQQSRAKLWSPRGTSSRRIDPRLSTCSQPASFLGTPSPFCPVFGAGCGFWG